MGYYNRKLFNTVRQLTGPDTRMCELGNQRIYLPKIAKPGAAAGTVFRKHVAKYACIDLNGKDGAVKLDLSKPLEIFSPGFRMKRWDLVTNIGTSEHVTDQYQVFRNAHRMAPRMVHALPVAGTWRGEHGVCQYTPEFLPALAEAAQYKVEEIFTAPSVRNGRKKGVLQCAVLAKTIYKFVSEEEFLSKLAAFIIKNKP